MAKRKRGGAQQAPSRDDDDFRPGNSKLAITSYEDVAGSDDEFHINRDRIFLDDGPQSKRRKQFEDEMIEASDEEVLGYSDSQADEDSDNEDDEDRDAVTSEDELENDGTAVKPDDEDEDTLGWGDSRSDYYNADKIQTEEEALAEEQEARRLQQKRRKALREADFAFEETTWRTDDDRISGEEHQDGAIVEVLPQLEIDEAMAPEARLKMLKLRYPEFEPLSQELLTLQPLYAELSTAAKAFPTTDSITPVKFQALSAYLGSLAMYFALLTSSSENGDKLPMAPHLLREHEIMDTLVSCRESWDMVRDLRLSSPLVSDELAEPLSSSEAASEEDVDRHLLTSKPAPTKSKSSTDVVTAASEARRAARRKATEASLASLDADLAASKKRNGANATSTALLVTNHTDVDSDIGDEPTLTEHEAAEKARKKRSLRFYTSQIAQKANKRANAGRAAGGDDDLPRRERLRDRQDRLMKEAEKRGQQVPDKLGHDSGNEDGIETNLEREEKLGTEQDDGYVRALEGKVAAKKANKKSRDQAYAQAREEGAQVVRHVDAKVGADGRREIGYQIQKNKGLTPKRSKDVKNPRVKKRRKFEDKTKKLASMKPIYKGGEGRGGYGGELTGIKKGLVRSVKL